MDSFNNGGGLNNPSYVSDINDEENGGHRMTDFNHITKSNGKPTIETSIPRREASKSLFQLIAEHTGLSKYSDLLWKILKWGLFVAFHIYIIVAIVYHVRNELPILWCDGLGIIILIMILCYVSKAFSLLSGLITRSQKYQDTKQSLENFMEEKLMSKVWFRVGIYVFVALFILIFLLVDANGDPRRYVSIGGLVVMILFGTIFSKHPKDISWRQVTWGMVLQFLMALFILRWNTGRAIIQCLGDKVEAFLAFTDVGSGFMYGYLVTQKPFIPARLDPEGLAYNVTKEINEKMAMPTVVTFKALSVVYFFSFFVNILFYFGVIQSMTRGLGTLLKMTISTSACESLNAAANIFLGQALSPMLIKPYLNYLTLSEIHSVMASGFATIAGVVMAAYITFGVSSAHLLSASVMSAPAALAYAKLLYPETEPTSDETMVDEKSEEEKKEEEKAAKESTNLLAEATKGATDGAVLVMNIVGIVIACIAMIAFLNSIVSFLFGQVGWGFVDFEYFLGLLFTPLAFILGIEWKDCRLVGKLIGIKTVVNEFIAYRELGQIIQSGSNVLSPRSAVIATYALCGFANPACIGIQLATLCSICPERKKDYSVVVARSFVAGVAACLMTACFAGALLSDDAL